MSAPADAVPREALMDPQSTVLRVGHGRRRGGALPGRAAHHREVPRPRARRRSSTSSYEYRYFTSGEDFLATWATAAQVDLLLLDLKLPGIERDGRARRPQRAGP